MPYSGVSRHRGNACVSSEGSELTGKGMEMREIVVDDKYEAPMLVTGGGLSNGGVVEVYVVSLAEMLLRDCARDTALGHVRRMGGPNVYVAGMAMLVGKVKFIDPVSVDVDVDNFDVGGSAKADVSAI
jgi:hypothetical protein